MPISYPIVRTTGGGGGSGDATSINGVTLSTNNLENGKTLQYENYGTPQWRAEHPKKQLPMYSGGGDFSATSQTTVTKFFLNDIAKRSEQTAYVYVTIGISPTYSGTIYVNGNSGKVGEVVVTSDSEYSSFSFPLTSSQFYSMYASSSNASSNFKIYNTIIEFF